MVSSGAALILRSTTCGVLGAEAAIFAAHFFTKIAFLWYNVIGCVVVVAAGALISSLERQIRKAE